MRRRLVLVTAVAAVLICACTGAASALTIQTVTSSGGITAWLVEDHSLPVVSLEVAFLGGSVEDPPAKAGLTELAFDLLDEGAGNLDSIAFKARLENLASGLNFSVDRDMETISLRTLTSNFTPTLDLLRMALTAPRFSDTAVARVRSQLVDALEEGANEPEYLADRLWWRTEFAGHSYAMPRRGTPETIARITPADLRTFMHDRVARDVMLVGVVGDVTPARLAPLLDKTFSGLSAQAVQARVTTAMPHVGGEVLLQRMKIPQSVVVFGQPGIRRDDPDWYASYLVMHILGGGGLTSRLAREVREKRGFAYSVYAELDPLLHGGVILGSLGTGNAHVADSIAIVRSEWSRMRDHGPTVAELAAAKTYITGSFPLNFDSTPRVADLLVVIQKDHLGVDYLDRRSALINAVTLADVRRVAKRILNPAALTFAVVGAPSALPGARIIVPGG